MSRPPTEQGMAEALAFFARTRQEGGPQSLPGQEAALHLGGGEHCLATLLELAGTARAPAALAQARARVAD